MQSEPNDAASPRPAQQRRNQNRQTRSHQQYPHDSLEIASDSNIASANTPRSKKTSKGHQHSDRAASATTQHGKAQNAQQRHRPASANTHNGNLTATPAKAIYAGAAFHASPAASSLPVPKFFSKSVPGNNGDSALQARADREERGLEPNANAENNLSGARSAVKSPLDMFFAADRQEKARIGSTAENRPSSANARTATPSKSQGMFTLDLDEPSSAADQQATPTANRSPLPPANPTPHSSHGDATASLKAFLNINPIANTNNTSNTTPNHLNFASTPNRHLQTPAAPQDPSLHYGNRNLSPLFQAAAARPSQSPGPSQIPPPSAFPPHGPFQDQYQRSSADHYASVYGMSPTRSSMPPSPYMQRPQPTPQDHGSPYRPMQQLAFVPQSPYHQPPQHHMQQPQRHPIPAGGNDGANDVKSMEERMKRMLNMK